MPNLSIGPGSFNFVQRARQHQRQRGFIAAIGSGTATYTGLAASVLVEPVKVVEQLRAELVDESEHLRPFVEKLFNELKTAQNEAEKSESFRTFIEAAIEGAGGPKARLDTLRGRGLVFGWALRKLFPS
jgi:hypothetical protein